LQFFEIYVFDVPNRFDAIVERIRSVDTPAQTNCLAIRKDRIGDCQKPGRK